MFRRGIKLRLPRKIKYPLFVKSTTEDASLGISQASIVTDKAQLKQRIEFVHDQVQTDALVEEYIEGRELYVGVMGNDRLTRLPMWEMKFGSLSESSAGIATRRVKWDKKYQKKHGIDTYEAQDLPPAVVARLDKLSRRIYRCLGLSGCARIDYRMNADGQIYVIEANPNPNLAADEDFAQSALAAGVGYPGAAGKTAHARRGISGRVARLLRLSRDARSNRMNRWIEACCHVADRIHGDHRDDGLRECARDRTSARSSAFIQTATGEFVNASGNTLVMVPVYARMIGLDTLFVERIASGGAPSERLVSPRDLARWQEDPAALLVFTQQGQWRNLRENPELFSALLPKDVRPAGTCDIKLSEDLNSAHLQLRRQRAGILHARAARLAELSSCVSAAYGAYARPASRAPCRTT